jgi:hypothetical protein
VQFVAGDLTVRGANVRNIRRIQLVSSVVVCLSFTGAGVGWADPARPAPGVEDPYAPHVTNGSMARIGTVVGFVYGEPDQVVALGLAASAGYRFGRLAIESEVDYLDFEAPGHVRTAIGPGAGNISIGHGERLLAIARYDVVRLGPHVVGPNSLLSAYIEGGGAVAWNHWSRPAPDQPDRIVPDDTRRPEGVVGFGLTLDHRLQEPVGFPHRIAWYLGWRLEMTPHEPMTGSVCRGTSCRAVAMTDSGGYVDRSMLFQSSLGFTF